MRSGSHWAYAPLGFYRHFISNLLLIIMPIKKPNNGASQPSSDLRQASLYAALLLGYTIHFIYCIWGNLRIAASQSTARRLLGGLQPFMPPCVAVAEHAL